MKPLYQPIHHQFSPYNHTQSRFENHSQYSSQTPIQSQEEWISHAPPSTLNFSSNSPNGYSSSSGINATSPSFTSKLTPSCSRCRAKKLKCRFDDPNSSACSICIHKGLANECHRDVRLSRSKKTKLSKDPKSKKPRLSISATTLHDFKEKEGDNLKSEEEEEKKKKKKLKVENRFIKPPSPASTIDETATIISASNIKSYDTIHDAQSEYQKQRETEDAALLLEEFATQSRQRSRTITTSRIATPPLLPPDVAQLKWQNPSTLPERLDLLQKAKACPFASDEVIVRELVSVYLYRVNHLAGHTIYGPGYQRAVEAFLSMSVEEIVMSKIFVDPCCLATLMLVLCLGFEFHPWQPPPGRPLTPGFRAIQSIRQQNQNPTKLWYSIARRCVAIEDSYNLSSIPALQAACLLLVYGKESKGWMRMLHQVSVVSAQEFNLHKLGRNKNHNQMEVDDFIRLEIGIRIWNFLVMRDWTMAVDQSHIFLIHPDQMTTRKPLNIEDEDLEEGLQVGQPRHQWTMMSYVIVQIELSELMRQSVLLLNDTEAYQSFDDADCKGRISKKDILKDKLDKFIDDLPHYFQLKSKVNTPGLVHVQRWLIYQQIFDLQLRLWRSEIGSNVKKKRKGCLQLAENIIMHQANIRAICPVINNLQINFFHLFGACMIILMDLIQCAELNTQSEDLQEKRIEKRARLSEAIAMFPMDQENKRGLQVLQVLMAIEEEEFEASRNTSTSQDVINLTLIADRITREIQIGSGKNDIEPNKDIWPALLSQKKTNANTVTSDSIAPPSIPIQTLLPIAGAWQSSDYDLSKYHPYRSSSCSNTPNAELSTSSPYQSSSSSHSNYHQQQSQAPFFDWIMSLGRDPFAANLSNHQQSIDMIQQEPLRRASLPRIF